FDTNLDEYLLEMAPFGSEAYTLLARGIVPISNAILARLDPESMINGAYLLRLTGKDISGRSTEVIRLIEIDSQTKLEAFTYRITDLDVTLNGVPVKITRNYSSLSAEVSGSFGKGWNLLGAEPMIETNVIPTGEEALGRFNPFSLNTRAYVTLPDGHRCGFTFTPKPISFGGKTFYLPSWTPDLDSNGYELSSSKTYLELVEGKFYQIGTGLPYNPASGRFLGFDWLIQAPDGTRYGYDTEEGLREIVDQEGRVLIWSDSGIIALNGERIGFEKDHSGDILSITTSDGQEVRYSYDQSGNLIQVNNIQSGERTVYGYNTNIPNLISEIVEVDRGRGQAIEYDDCGKLVAIHPIGHVLGFSREFLGSVVEDSLNPGEVDHFAIILNESEISSTNIDSVTIGLEVIGLNGFNPGTVSIFGQTSQLSKVESGRSLSLINLNKGGPYVIEVRGDEGKSGSYQLKIYLPGDVNADFKVDGFDEAVLSNAIGSSQGDPRYVFSADADRDGDVDLTDKDLLSGNFGFIANHAPVVTDGSARTLAGFPMDIDLSYFVSDLDGFYQGIGISNVEHGRIVLFDHGKKARFIPEDNFIGKASFNFWADDGSLISNLGTISIDVVSVDFKHLHLAKRDLLLMPGQSEIITVLGELPDGEMINLPSNLIQFTSTDPSIAIVSESGTIYGLAEGSATILIMAGGLLTATPVTVGAPPMVGPLEFFPMSYALTVGEQRRFIVREQIDDLHVVERQAEFYLENPMIGALTEDGLFTATGLGETRVTMIFKGKSEVGTLTVVSPSIGSGSLGADGGIIVSHGGGALIFGPNTLSENTSINLTDINEDSLPYDLPFGFDFAGAIQVDLNGKLTNENLALGFQMPAPDDAKPGDILWLFRPGKIQIEPGVFHDSWELLDRMVVG
ncbi:MAG: dockerin type I domain-containing protein, partial [Halobacteria archaeon]